MFRKLCTTFIATTVAFLPGVYAQGADPLGVGQALNLRTDPGSTVLNKSIAPKTEQGVAASTQPAYWS
jgi:hypothetical protein